MKNLEISADDFIEVPMDRLREDVLNGIIDEFVLQEGTDYGQEEYSLSEKREQVKSQIRDGRALIVFNQKTETCSVVSTNEWRR